MIVWGHSSLTLGSVWTMQAPRMLVRTVSKVTGPQLQQELPCNWNEGLF